MRCSILFAALSTALFASSAVDGVQARQSRTRRGKDDTASTTSTSKAMDVAALRWDTVVELHDKHHPSTNMKNFPGDSLVYVTPWNSQGYDVAKKFAGKFTYVSPVWLQLRADENGRAVVAGLHDIDQGWMRAVRSVCGTDEGVCPRIVPRLMWEATSLSAEEHKRSIDLIAQVVDEHGFDGIVLERPLARPVFRWAELLANRLHALRTPPPLDPALRFHATKHLVVVAPPTLRGRDGSVVRGLAPADFVAVMKFADRLSLMTYDFSSSRGVVGPNAPLEWVRESASSLLSTVTDPNERRALAAKVLVGLAMYGYVTPKRWGPRGASSSTPPRSLDRSLDRSHTHSQPRQRRGDPGEHVNRAAAGAPTDAATGREGGGALLRLQGSERRGAPGVLPDAVLRPGPSGRREGAGHGGVGVGDRTGSARVVRPLLRRASGLRLVGDTHSEIAHDETPRRHTPDTHRVQHLTVALAAQSPGPRDSGPPRTREDRPTTPESGSSS